MRLKREWVSVDEKSNDAFVPGGMTTRDMQRHETLMVANRSRRGRHVQKDMNEMLVCRGATTGNV